MSKLSGAKSNPVAFCVINRPAEWTAAECAKAVQETATQTDMVGWLDLPRTKGVQLDYATKVFTIVDLPSNTGSQ